MIIPRTLEFFAILNLIEKDDPRFTLEVDFRGTEWSEPSGSLLLIRWLKQQRLNNRNVVLSWGGLPNREYVQFDTLPLHNRWLQYQLYNGFYDALLGGDVQPFRENGLTRDRYVPYCELTVGPALNGSHAQRIAGETAAQLSRQILKEATTEETVVATFRRALQELLENIVFYAGVNHCYVMAQYAPRPLAKRDNRQVLQIAILDEGCGLLERLRESQNIADHLGAIEKAIEAGISSTDEAMRGYGLATLLSASAQNGRMLVATGNENSREPGQACWFNNGDQGGARTYPLAGTFIALDLLPELVDFAQIDERLSIERRRMGGTIHRDR